MAARGFEFATYDEGYTLALDEFAVTTTSGNSCIWERSGKGVIYGVYLQLSGNNYAVRCTIDGRDISVLDKSVEELIAAGLDIPSPVFPHAFANADEGVYTWIWTPREGRLAEYRDRAYIEVASGCTVFAKIYYAESRE